VRILLATDWNRGRGGAEAYVAGLKRALRDAGHDVRLLTSSAGSAGDGEAEHVAYGTERLALQSLLQIANPFAVAAARRALREFRPDVALVNMFAHHLSPAFVTALAPVPIVLVVSDYKVLCPIGTKLRPDGTRCRVPAGLVCLGAGCVGVPHWLRDRPRYAWIRAAIGRASRVVACSRFVAAELAAEGIAAEVLIWPSPPPSPDYRREPAAEPTFLFCGRLDAEKGVELLLGAFAALRRELPDARLRIVGRGSRERAMQRLARAPLLRDATTFLGWLDPPGVESELSRATALVAPSLWAEPLGLVAVEAIVRGVPVIASAEGGFAETVVEGRSGLLFPNGDVAALVRRMRSVARRESFPDRTLAPDVVEEARRRHAIEPHVVAVERILAAATAPEKGTFRISRF
jgi:glycosyltransferase involved in cell wall biosynthesis